MSHANAGIQASPAPPRATAWRVAWLLPAFALPATAWLALWAGAMVVATAGANDRSLAWVTGDDAQLRQLEAGLRSHPVFTEGALLRAGVERWRPAACDPASVAVGFSHLRPHERAASQAALRELIDAAGAKRCRVHTFVQSDLPTPLEAAGWPSSLPTLVLLFVVPGGLVLVAHRAVRGQGLVDGLWRWPQGPRARRTAWAVLAALAALGVAQALPGAGVPASGQGIPVPAMLLLVFFAPLLEEASLRGWLQPIATRATGPVAAVLLSALATAVLRSPADATGWLAGLALGLLLALLMRATRSIPACVLANAAGVAALLAMQAAVA